MAFSNHLTDRHLRLAGPLIGIVALVATVALPSQAAADECFYEPGVGRVCPVGPSGNSPGGTTNGGRANSGPSQRDLDRAAEKRVQYAAIRQEADQLYAQMEGKHTFEFMINAQLRLRDILRRQKAVRDGPNVRVAIKQNESNLRENQAGLKAYQAELKAYNKPDQVRARQAHNVAAQGYLAGDRADWAAAAAYFKAAHELNPDEPVYRENLVIAQRRLAEDQRETAMGQRIIDAEAQRLRDERLEADRLRNEASERARQAQLAAAQRLQDERAAVSTARTNIQTFAQNLSVAKPGSDLSYGDLQASVQTNPAANTAEGRAAAAGPLRQAGLIRANGALEQAQIAGTGQASTGRVVDGGTAHNDTSGTGTLVVVPTPKGVELFSASDLARYNRSHRFREANSAVTQAKAEAEDAERLRASLKARQEATIDRQALQQIQIELVDAEKAVQRTLGAQRIVENKLSEVVVQIEREGTAEMENGQPAVPSKPKQ